MDKLPSLKAVKTGSFARPQINLAEIASSTYTTIPYTSEPVNGRSSNLCELRLSRSWRNEKYSIELAHSSNRFDNPDDVVMLQAALERAMSDWTWLRTVASTLQAEAERQDEIRDKREKEYRIQREREAAEHQARLDADDPAGNDLDVVKRAIKDYRDGELSGCHLFTVYTQGSENPNYYQLYWEGESIGVTEGRMCGRGKFKYVRWSKDNYTQRDFKNRWAHASKRSTFQTFSSYKEYRDHIILLETEAAEEED